MKDVSIMIENVIFNYRAGIMIECGDKVLVEVNPDIDFVTLPGGRIHTLETSIDGLKREIKEELNYELPNDIKLRGIIENFFGFEEKKYHELYFLYKYKIEKDNPLYNDSLKNDDRDKNYFKWVKKDELDKVNLLPRVLRTWANSEGFNQEFINDLKLKK